MNVYNTTLERRLARKSFIFDRKITDDYKKVLIGFTKIQSLEKKRSREEKDMYQKWRVFARMQTEEDFETLMEGIMCKSSSSILDELKLRNSISQHQEYLRMGIRTLKEANEYEKHKVAKVSTF